MEAAAGHSAVHIGVESTPKRNAIVSAASRLFLDSGYGETSMDAIAAEAEVSKRTVYSYFPGKDALFEAVMTDLCESETGMSNADLPDDPADQVLPCVGRNFLKIISSDMVLTIFRIAASESARFPELGDTFYRAGPQRSIQNLAAYLRGRERAGELQIADPEMAAAQFLALVKSDYFVRLVLGVGPKPSEADVERVVSSAVQVFLRGYSRPAG
ncbi:TetR/AcrR family transcriptional regulator [Pelagibius sp. Alg239-R121]|uniref:TetR/AcrR family transcriptional regulator n=1 Tax=Pelagibius sp. Alg239-R121 TaxID=2993448 RepID=UPI0024A79BF1|nr:TetR/AcrR family transcriptional regulator [Pelagibius sp. Alg239-R121]